MPTDNQDHHTTKEDITVTDELEESVEDLSLTVQRLTNRFNATRRDVFTRFPLAFTLLGAFGFVATLYGFENLIDRIPLFANNPSLLLVTGLAILVLTGQLYKKLGD